MTDIEYVNSRVGGAVSASKTYNVTKETIGSKMINAIIDFFTNEK